MEGLRPLLSGGLQEKWSREIMRHHEGGGGASQLVYVHVTWTLSSCGLPLLPLCLIISPLSRNLPPSHQTDGSTHMAVLSPSLPLSHSITLMHCGSVGCCVRSWMGSLKLFPSLKSLFLSRSVTFIPSSYSSAFPSCWELLLVFLLLPMLAHQTCMCCANRIPWIGIQLMLNSCTWVYLRSNCC